MMADRRPGAMIADILKGSWRDDCGTPSILPGTDISGLIKILTSTGAAGLAYRRLGHHKGGEALKSAAQKQKIAHLLQKRVILSVAEDLEKLGVSYLFFKGWVAARDYADPAYRPMGDVDILVDPDAFSEVLRYFSSLIGQPWSPGSSSVVGVCVDGVPGATMLDVHTNLKKHGLGHAADMLQDCAHSELAGQSLPHLDDASHLRQLCVHGLIHGFWRALWLCDIAAFVEKRGPGIDWGAVSGGDLVIKNWVGICLGLARDLLGMDTSHVPDTLCAEKIPNWVSKSILNAWSKDFGSYHNRVDLGFTLRHKPWHIPIEFWRRRPNTLGAVAEMGWRIPPRRTPLIPLAHVANRARKRFF